MIVVDTSALMTIVLREPGAERYAVILGAHPDLAISAATYVEAGVVAARRGLSPDMQDLLDATALEVVEVTQESARRAIQAYRRWEKSFHLQS